MDREIDRELNPLVFFLFPRIQKFSYFCRQKKGRSSFAAAGAGNSRLFFPPAFLSMNAEYGWVLCVVFANLCIILPAKRRYVFAVFPGI